jgi:hypothetical protein
VSQTEGFGNVPRHLADTPIDVDFDSVEPEHGCLSGQLVCEELIAGQEVRQGSLGISCLPDRLW